MFRRLNWVVFVLLMGVGLAALLPISGLYSAASCDWRSEGPAPHAALTALPTLSLSLRTPDAAVGVSLRAGLSKRLTEHGVTDLVDNPLTYPRAQITVTEMDGRWTPFWARLTLKAHVVVDRKKDRNGNDVSVDVSVHGSCTGLVSGDQWQTDALDLLAHDVVAQIVP